MPPFASQLVRGKLPAIGQRHPFVCHDDGDRVHVHS